MNVHKIISFDSNKVWFEFKDGVKICKKRTIGKEVEALIQAKEYLYGKKINALGKEYSLSTPNVLNWKENTGILMMSFCEGENLESMICNSKAREQGVELLKEMLRFTLKNKFFWNDFAPRNIIVDDNNNIFIMDFEHGIGDKDISLEDFLRMRVYREYSSFILPEERKLSIEKVFNLRNGEENQVIDTNSCSKRIIALAKLMGYYPTMTTQQSLDIQKKIIIAEQPYMKDGKINYPRIMVEKLLEEGNDSSFDTYAKFVLRKSQISKEEHTQLEL